MPKHQAPRSWRVRYCNRNPWARAATCAFKQASLTSVCNSKRICARWPAQAAACTAAISRHQLCARPATAAVLASSARHTPRGFQNALGSRARELGRAAGRMIEEPSC
jgi:hypothetical protein